ncbi:kinase domain protein [Penicillium nucicola]|uniref:kinase domain protein n=1 Tax=Penicillium nucicola TaxID=1850975 RepID=UPI0025459CD2|nr:kinase domain protein [Penicillium nucicola]KAJ5775544.1 kinase domain protein [Penicillium nucicola]
MTLKSTSLKMSPLGWLRSTPSKSRPIPASVLRASQCVEEERAPHYNPKHFYPMRLHEILADRYQVAVKLGWGTSSTVWLARDLHQWRWLPPRYVAIKVNANNYLSDECARKELRITERITQANPANEGRYFVRTLLDSFELSGPDGNHICMVFDPLYEPLWMLKRRFQGDTLPPDILKTIVQLVTMGLHYLHTEAHIIHTDLKSDNILMALRDPSILDAVVHDEIENPLPQKNVKDRTIYLSRNNFGLQVDNLGRPVITDFGLSVEGDQGPYNHPIQPNGFRAPEVIIGANWDYSTDIWNFGALIWELLCGTGPFDYSTSSSGASYSEEKHLASIISLIGPPPEDMLKRGSQSSRYFNGNGISITIFSSLELVADYPTGQFKCPDLIPKARGLEQKLMVIEGEEKRLFLKFISRLLQWRPEDRGTAQELLSDPWLKP